MTELIVILAVLALLVGGLIVIYNKLVRRRNLVMEGWSGIEVQLKRRANLIPNLVETVKGYMGHERKLLTEVAVPRELLRKILSLIDDLRPRPAPA